MHIFTGKSKRKWRVSEDIQVDCNHKSNYPTWTNLQNSDQNVLITCKKHTISLDLFQIRSSYFETGQWCFVRGNCDQCSSPNMMQVVLAMTLRWLFCLRKLLNGKGACPGNRGGNRGDNRGVGSSRAQWSSNQMQTKTRCFCWCQIFWNCLILFLYVVIFS